MSKNRENIMNEKKTSESFDMNDSVKLDANKSVVATTIESLPVSEAKSDVMEVVENNPHQVLSAGRELKPSHGGLFGELEALQIHCEKNNKHNLASEIQCLLSNLGAVKVHAQSIEQRYGNEIQEIESLLSLFK